jgi:hypothetical protein
MSTALCLVTDDWHITSYYISTCHFEPFMTVTNYQACSFILAARGLQTARNMKMTSWIVFSSMSVALVKYAMPVYY